MESGDWVGLRKCTMKLPNNLDQLDNLIKDTSDKTDALKHHIKGLEDNVALLTNLEKTLQQNLSVLKDHAIIAMASEFKKIKEDLGKVARNIDVSAVDLRNSKLFLEKSQKLLIELREQYAIIKESQKGKVLTGHFGKN